MAHTIRPAHPDEAEMLTALMRRSKAYWGYSPAFMLMIVDQIRISAEQIADHTDHFVYVLEDQAREDAAGQIAGMVHLRTVEGNRNLLCLEDLFVEPDFIGKGYGKALFEYAVSITREGGYQGFTFEADPNAEPFYLKMGAVRIGARESAAMKGRILPQMQYLLPKGG